MAVHSRDVETWHRLEPIAAAHGPDCGPRPARHRVSAYEDAVYSCADHVMTAINASGYAAIYLTPDRMVDFSKGEAVIAFDVSTLRSSSRDWWDIWLTPYDDNLQLPLDDDIDLAGPPRRAVQVRMNDDNSAIPRIYRNHREHPVESEWSTGYESVLTPDSMRRDGFELRISRTRIAFGMPEYGLGGWTGRSRTWVGDRAIVQLGHHSYNPTKDNAGTPNTWHWDNVSIDPAVPFTIINADRRYVDADTSRTLTFEQPAPVDAHLRFSAMGERMRVSFDGGTTWEQARRPPHAADNGFLFSNYWTPVPEGAQRVRIRGENGWLPAWIAKDFAIWSTSAPW